MRKQHLRRAQMDTGEARCGRKVSAEWVCVGCGAPTCETQSQCVVFGNFGNFSDRPGACWCSDCLVRLPEAQRCGPENLTYARRP